MLENKIKDMLKAKRRTLKELCEAISMSDTAMRNIYKRDSCELSTLRAIADFFSVPVTDLLEETDYNITICDNQQSFNPGQNDTETIQELTRIVDEQRKRIDYLTDQLLKTNK